MIAFALTIGLFCFWAVVGFSILTVVHIAQPGTTRSMLLAPAVGVAATLMPLLWLNHAGLPVAQFALPLTAVLGAACTAVVLVLRPQVGWRQYAPFAGLLLAALWLTGRPLLEFGFNWLSFVNGDMLFYSMGAQRLLQHGFWEAPSVAAMLRGADPSLNTWFSHLWERSGAETLLAWLAGITGLSTDRLFMPMILSLQLVLISSATALVYLDEVDRSVALAGAAILAVAALPALGAIWQLLAQVGGLGLLAACMAALTGPHLPRERSFPFGRALIAGLLLAALLSVYPELLPVLAIAVALYWAMGVALRRKEGRDFAAAGLSAVLAAILLNPRGALAAGPMLAERFGRGSVSTSLQAPVFPFFLKPSGLADLWGLQSLAMLPPEPVLSITILLGGLLLLVAAAAAVQACVRLRPHAFVALVMLALGLWLFLKSADFGVFKTALYVSPFLLLTIVWAVFQHVGHRAVRLALLVALALPNLATQADYVRRSRGEGTAFNMIPGASVDGLGPEIDGLLASTQAPAILIDTTNPLLAGLIGLRLTGRPTHAPVRERHLFTGGFQFSAPPTWALPPGIPALAQQLTDATGSRFVPATFDLHAPDGPHPTNAFLFDTATPPQDDTAVVMISASSRQSVINRSHSLELGAANLVITPLAQARDHLVFVASELGPPFYTADRSRIAIHQLEPDFFYAGQTLAGAGRHVLFQVLQPTPGARVLLEITASLNADGESRLPPADVIGTQRLPFPILGRGSARVYSPALTAQSIDGLWYAGIDMGIDGKAFPMHRSGLMQLYGTDVPADSRMLVGFVRNISLVSATDAAGLVPPSRLDSFPAGLADPSVEYSGLYEDGWVAEEAFVRLTQPAGSRTLVIRGTVPESFGAGFRTELRMLLDGELVLEKRLRPGQFDLQAGVAGGVGSRRVEIHFTNVRSVSPHDVRPAAALLEYLGFEEPYASQ